MKKLSKRERARRRSQSQRSVASEGNTPSIEKAKKEDDLDWSETRSGEKVFLILFAYLFSLIIGFFLGLLWGGGLAVALVAIWLWGEHKRDGSEPEPEIFLGSGLFMLFGVGLNFFYFEKIFNSGPTWGDIFGVDPNTEPPIWFIILILIALAAGAIRITIRVKHLFSNDDDCAVDSTDVTEDL